MLSTKKTATINFNSSITLKWFGRLPNTQNDFVHWWQEKVFSPLCTLIQILRMSILLNEFIHRKTLYVDVDALRECTLCTLVFRRLPNTLNYFVHWWQEKVISPLCTLVQILRMSNLLNDFVQKKAPEGILPRVHSQMILTDVHSCMLLNYPKHQIILHTEGSCRYSNQSVLVSCGP